MCRNMGASVAMAGVGLAATGYLIAKGRPTTLCAPMGFVTKTEMLQAASDPVIGQCGQPANYAL